MIYNVMDNPLVSIICFCKNSREYIRNCIESVLAQEYENFEFLIQDGASTDGTLEIIREYRDSRIKLVSEPDTGGGDAASRVLNRIRGEIFGSCLSDEEMLPHAVGWAVRNFSLRPDVAVIYGDSYVINDKSEIIQETLTHPWDYSKYICCEIVPPFSATFFRTDAFRRIGFSFDNYNTEFDLFLKMGSKYIIEYIPDFIAKFRRHSGSNSSTVSDYYRTLPGRMKAIETITEDPDVSEELRRLKLQAKAGVHLWYAECFTGNGYFYQALKHLLISLRYGPHMVRFKGVSTFLLNCLKNTFISKVKAVVGFQCK